MRKRQKNRIITRKGEKMKDKEMGSQTDREGEREKKIRRKYMN